MNPVIIIIQTFQARRVRFLLMGGQACILYGASEFTRDSDFCVLCNGNNLENVKAALADLKARRIFFPPLGAQYLARGHACHFICQTRETKGFRIDVMSRMRNCPAFEKMWLSRRYMKISGKTRIPVLGLEHLVAAKKTQRDKDWPMVRRLVETDMALERRPVKRRVLWWFLECRTPRLIVDLFNDYPDLGKVSVKKRPLLAYAASGDVDMLEKALLSEELEERRIDREYWKPLREELERMRHEREK